MRRKWGGKKSLLVGLASIVLLAGGYLTFRVLVRVAGIEARRLVAVASAGQKYLLWTATRTTLVHLAGLPEVRRLESSACRLLDTDFAGGEGIFTVLAIGDAAGNAVCTADPKIATPLPTMSDRLYYQRVKQAKDMVVGEYAISKTTGKPVLHLAYPMRDTGGKFSGLVMAAVDLRALTNQEVKEAFAEDGAQLAMIDSSGKVLLAYPEKVGEVGETIVSVEMLNGILSDQREYQLLRGRDGRYYVYAYEYLGQGMEDVVLFAGVALVNYRPLALIAGLALLTIIWVSFALGCGHFRR